MKLIKKIENIIDIKTEWDIKTMVFIPQQPILIYIDNDKICELDLNSWKTTIIFESENELTSLDISNDNNFLAIGDDYSTIEILNLRNSFHRSIKSHRRKTTSLKFSTDSNLLFSAHSDHIIRIWNINSFKDQGEITADKINFTEVFILGDCIGSLGSDGIIYLWDQQGKELKYCIDDNHGLIDMVSVHKSKELIVYKKRDNLIKIISLNNEEIMHLEKFEMTIRILEISPDGNFILTGDEEGILKIWDINTGYLANTIDCDNLGIASVAMSSNFEKIAIGGEDSSLKIYSVSYK